MISAMHFSPLTFTIGLKNAIFGLPSVFFLNILDKQTREAQIKPSRVRSHQVLHTCAAGGSMDSTFKGYTTTIQVCSGAPCLLLSHTDATTAIGSKLHKSTKHMLLRNQLWSYNYLLC